MRNSLKFNPFRPNNIAVPGMFTGRMEELRSIEQSLFQTKNGNPKHFLIEGERGIGKSSLFMFVDCVAKGEIEPIFANTKFSFLAASVELSTATTNSDIIRKIASDINAALVQRGHGATLAKVVVDFMKSWKILGIEFNSQRNFSDPAEVMEDLTRTLARVLKDAKAIPELKIDGIVILLDEADKPASGAGLGEFSKLFTERLTKSGCDQVCLGLAGLPILIPKLRESHESSPRVFDVMTLQPLTDVECKNVVRRGLEAGNKQSGIITTITDPALALLAELSEGYPHFIQQFAYSAFEEDVDDTISELDVSTGAFKENGALDQLGKRYFNAMYFERVWSEDYKKVLHAMTEHLDAWIPRAAIIKESGIKESQVTNALNALTQRQVILHSDQKRGEYKLPTRAFAVWIKALLAKQASIVPGAGTLFEGQTEVR